MNKFDLQLDCNGRPILLNRTEQEALLYLQNVIRDINKEDCDKNPNTLMFVSLLGMSHGNI